MKFFNFSNLAKGSVLIVSAALLTACGGSSSSSDENPTGSSVNLPDGKNLVFIDASSPMHYRYNTTTEKATDINDEASKSGETAVQNLAVNDVSVIGSFFFWADDKDADGSIDDEKILLMKPGYQSGGTIDHTNMQYLAHFHGEELAAHAASEFDSAQANWEGSTKQAGLARLNSYVTKQKELFDEVDEALETLAAGQTLCKAYIDPYAGAEHEGEAHAHVAAEAEEEEHVVHIALTNTGRLYFMEEEEGALKLSQDTFVALTGVSSIDNCAKTEITRVNEHGVLIFVEASQKVYMVDTHGGDWHEHSNWDISQLMPSGFHADFMAALGAGSEDDHDHDHEDGDHEGEDS